MRKWIEGFASDEDGAVTVDWVVLTALIVGLQILMLVAPIRDGLVGVSEDIGDTASTYGAFLEE